MTQPEPFDPIPILIETLTLTNQWSQPSFVQAQIQAAELILRHTVDAEQTGDKVSAERRATAFDFLRKVATGGVLADTTAKVRAIAVYMMSDRERSK